MINKTRWGLVVWFAAVAGLARGDEQKVEVKDVPQPIQKAIAARYPKSKITEASREEEDGKTVYEVEVKDGDTEYDVSAAADGTLLEVEKEIDAAKLPKAVTAAIEAKYPKSKVSEAEEVTTLKKTGDTMTYEVMVTTDKGKKRELELSSEGKILDDDEAEDDDDKDDKKKDDDKPKSARR